MDHLCGSLCGRSAVSQQRDHMLIKSPKANAKVNVENNNYNKEENQSRFVSELKLCDTILEFRLGKSQVC